jgi:hypothetical protein
VGDVGTIGRDVANRMDFEKVNPLRYGWNLRKMFNYTPPIFNAWKCRFSCPMLQCFLLSSPAIHVKLARPQIVEGLTNHMGMGYVVELSFERTST